MIPDPAGRITYRKPNVFGSSFQCGQRTAAHIDATQMRLEVVRPGAELQIIQGCYNTGVAASAGTHDFDAVLDVQLVINGGLVDWDWSQRFLRESGWAAWHRTPAQGFGHHIHMVSLGYAPAPVGEFVPGQVDDYYRHAFGLKGMHDSGSDPSWFPQDIDATVFNYQEWELDNMPYRDWPQADKDALHADSEARLVPAVAAEVIAHLGEALITNPVDPKKAKWSFATILGSIYRRTAP